MADLVGKYVCICVLNRGYHHYYKQPIIRYLRNMTIVLFIETIIVFILKYLFPLYTPILYGLYNYLYLLKFISFLIRFKIIKSSKTFGAAIILIGLRYIAIEHILLDLVIGFLMIRYFWKISGYIFRYQILCKNMTILFYTNLTREMKLYLFLYVLVYLFSFSYYNHLAPTSTLCACGYF